MKLTERHHNLWTLLSLGVILGLFNASPILAQSNPEWTPIGWGQTSGNAIAGANYMGKDVYLYRANDSTNRLFYSVDGGPPQEILRTSTFAPPALVVFDNRLWAFHTGTDGNIYWDRLDLSGPDPQTQWHFTGEWTRVDTIGTPTGSTFVNRILRPAVTSNENNIYLAAAFNDNTMRWTTINGSGVPDQFQTIPGNGVTFNDISIMAIGSARIAAFHRGTDSNIYYNILQVDNNNFWRPTWTREPAGGRTLSGPTALDSFSPNFVWLSVLGVDNRPWNELLFYNIFSNSFEVTSQTWHVTPTTNVSTFTQSDVGLANLRGSGPAGTQRTTAITGIANEGNLIERCVLQ